jgi:phage replication O-like protein O
MPPVEKPNYTQVPNAILDALPSMSMPEAIVLIAICRQTFGWHKKSEKLSITQLQALTGLSKHAVIDALNAALADGWISRKPAGQTYRYTVNVQEVAVQQMHQKQEVAVQQMHRYPKRTGAANAPVSGAANAPVPAREMHRFGAKNPEVAAAPKERKESIKESNTTRVGENARDAQAKKPPAPVAIYEEIFDRKANSQQQEAIAAAVTDCAKWGEVLTTWSLKGHSATNIVDMLDVYANGWKQRAGANGQQPAPPPEPKTTRKLAQLIVPEK